MSGELKPCPFCGGEAKWDRIASPQAALFGVRVVCSECRAGVTMHSNGCEEEADEAAVAAWNRRSTDPTLLEALEACEENLRLIHDAAGRVSKEAPMPEHSSFSAMEPRLRRLRQGKGRGLMALAIEPARTLTPDSECPRNCFGELEYTGHEDIYACTDCGTTYHVPIAKHEKVCRWCERRTLECCHYGPPCEERLRIHRLHVGTDAIEGEAEREDEWATTRTEYRED